MAGQSNNSPYQVPDGGWGWLVCMGSFILQAATIGVTYTFGIIFLDLREYFESSESMTAWIGSIQPALLYFTGIIAGPMISRFGWRKVTIFGSLLSAVGFGISALTPNIYLLYLTYGVLTGVGNGCMYVTSMVCVQHYFSSRRAMATGIAVSGSGVGLLIFGVMSPALLTSVGWRWTLVVDAVIMLVLGCACAALFQPLPPKDPIPENDETPLLFDKDSIGKMGQNCQYTSSTCENSLSYGGVQIRSESQKSLQISPIPENTQSKEQTISLKIHESTDSPGCCRNLKCFSMFREIFDLSLFCNPVFTLFSFSTMMFGFGYHVPYTFTPERAILLGMSQKRASFLVSIMGMANIAFRLLLGWIADRNSHFRFYFGGTVLFLGGTLNILLVFFDTYPLMIIYSVAFGAISGCYASLFPVILVDLLGLTILEKSMGQVLAVSSVAFLFASPMSGFIIDQTGSVVIPFYVVGTAQLIGGVSFFSIKCFTHRYGIQSHLTDEERSTLVKRRRSSHLRISESFS